MREALKAAPSGRQFLRATLLSLADEVRRSVPPKGCLIMNTATEFAGRDPAVAALVADGARAFVQVFRAAVVRAQARMLPSTSSTSPGRRAAVSLRASQVASWVLPAMGRDR